MSRRKSLKGSKTLNINEPPLKLIEANHDKKTDITYYIFNKRIDYDDWKKVKQHFNYYNRMGDWKDCDDYGQTVGWMTTTPEKVEKILGITETVEKQKEEEELLKQLNKIETQKKLMMKHKLRKVFLNAEPIKISNLSEEIRHSKECYQDPDWSWMSNNSCGGGRIWVFSEGKICQIDKTNTLEDGSVEALKINYDETISNFIREYGEAYISK